jgi:hypothetical protein
MGHPAGKDRTVFFRKRTTIADFASELVALHANLFGRGTLLTLTEMCHVLIKDERRLANALSEWVFFGAYVIRQGVAAECKENTALCSAILDSFFAQMYAGFVKAGVKEPALPHLEHCLKARFREYDRAQLDSQGNPISDLSSAVSTLMFGDTMDGVMFSTLPALHFADSLISIKKLFDGFKILG